MLLLKLCNELADWLKSQGTAAPAFNFLATMLELQCKKPSYTSSIRPLMGSWDDPVQPNTMKSEV
jgi:hypothetical protein